MNKQQFSKVIKLGLEVYNPILTEDGHIINCTKSSYMCHCIDHLLHENKISYWEATNALKKINRIIYPKTVLINHLRFDKNIIPTREILIDFWKQYIIE